jgi:SAM-dependent methyltransferase
MMSALSRLQKYLVTEFDELHFLPRSRIVEIGFGTGAQLRLHADSGCHVVGLDPDEGQVAHLAKEGYLVVRAVGEAIPFRDEVFEGLLSRDMLQYTDEREAIREWARVLRPGGTVLLMIHGAGFYWLSAFSRGPIKQRFYGVRVIANSWCYRCIGRTLPGFAGDTRYLSRRQLSKRFVQFGFRIRRTWSAPRYAGREVFLYFELERTKRAAEADRSHPISPTAT